jgi:hypothetical protein
LTRFVGATEAPHDIEQIAADSTALLAHYLIESRTTHLVPSALDGTIRACNWRFADSLKAVRVGKMAGAPRVMWTALPGCFS